MFDEFATDFLKAEQKRKLDFYIGLQIIQARIENIEANQECEEVLSRPVQVAYITHDSKDKEEAQACMYGENL